MSEEQIETFPEFFKELAVLILNVGAGLGCLIIYVRAWMFDPMLIEFRMFLWSLFWER